MATQRHPQALWTWFRPVVSRVDPVQLHSPPVPDWLQSQGQVKNLTHYLEAQLDINANNPTTGMLDSELNLSSKDSKGRTCLALACMNGRENIVKEIADH